LLKKSICAANPFWLFMLSALSLKLRRAELHRLKKNLMLVRRTVKNGGYLRFPLRRLFHISAFWRSSAVSRLAVGSHRVEMLAGISIGRR